MNDEQHRKVVDTCAMSDTLLLVEQDQLFDPADSGDRVLLGCDPRMPVHKSVEFTPQHQEALR